MPRFSTTLAPDHTVRLLINAIESVPFRLIAHINGQANAAKAGITVTADQVLEFFRPDYAVQVWEAHKPAGIDIPLRMHVYEDQGRTWVSARLPSEIFLRYQNASLDRIGRELDALLLRVLSALDPHREKT